MRWPTWQAVQTLFPPLAWIPHALQRSLTQDLVAGLTVATVVVPQSIAYALLANLPPQSGLYSSVYPVLVFCLLGTTPVISTGPFALTSLVMGETLLKAVKAFPGLSISNVSSLITFCVGVVQMVLAITCVGHFIARHLLSKQLVSAFMSASACQIIASQLSPFLSLKASNIIGVATLPRQVYFALASISEWHWPSTCMGLSSVCALFTLKWVDLQLKRRAERKQTQAIYTATSWTQSPRAAYLAFTTEVCSWYFPVPDILVVIAITTGLTYNFSMDILFSIPVIGAIPRGFPSWSSPFQLYNDTDSNITYNTLTVATHLLSSIFILAVLSAVMTFGITLTFAANNSPNSPSSSPIRGQEQSKNDETEPLSTSSSLSSLVDTSLLPVTCSNENSSATTTTTAHSIITPKEKQKLSIIPSITQDLFTLGLSSVFGSMFQCYVSTGSLTRSLILRDGGAITPLATLVGVVVVMAAIQWLTSLFYYIPKCVLAAVIMVATRSLIVDIRTQGVTLIVEFIRTLRCSRTRQRQRVEQHQPLVRRGSHHLDNTASSKPLTVVMPTSMSIDQDHVHNNDTVLKVKQDALNHTNVNGEVTELPDDFTQIYHNANTVDDSIITTGQNTIILTHTLWQQANDVSVWWITFLAVVMINVQIGMLVAVVYNAIVQVGWISYQRLSTKKERYNRHTTTTTGV